MSPFMHVFEAAIVLLLLACLPLLHSILGLNEIIIEGKKTKQLQNNYTFDEVKISNFLKKRPKIN